jgi:peptidoglycan/xylan/chitin deacetylase (PgdA/CDA1 family)
MAHPQDPGAALDSSPWGAIALTALLAMAPAPAIAVEEAPPSPSPRPSRQEPSARERIIKRIENPGMRISITFDACATKTHGYGFDRPVYEVLKREKVPATIFTSGRWVEFHPQVMAELAADPLIEFGNHSYDHPHMSHLPAVQIEAQIDETEAALARYGKHSVAFRPPFGDFNARLLDVVNARGLPVVLWDVVSGDPSAATTARGMIHSVDRKTRVGSIVIFHINGRAKKTAAALPTILRDLRARGFELVPLSTLLASRGAGDGDGGGARPREDAVANGANAVGDVSAGALLPSGPMCPLLCEPPAPWEHIVPNPAMPEDEVCP